MTLPKFWLRDKQLRFRLLLSIHKSRWACRLVSEITSVRVEHLMTTVKRMLSRGIERRRSADGNWAHYADTGLSTDARGSYRSLWEDQRPRRG